MIADQARFGDFTSRFTPKKTLQKKSIICPDGANKLNKQDTTRSTALQGTLVSRSKSPSGSAAVHAKVSLIHARSIT